MNIFRVNKSPVLSASDLAVSGGVGKLPTIAAAYNPHRGSRQGTAFQSPFLVGYSFVVQMSWDLGS